MNSNKKIINTLSKITTVAVLSSFIYIGVNTQQAHALNSKIQGTQSQTKSNIQTGKVKLCDYLNVRKGASVKNTVVTKLYTNDVVEILEKASNGWYKVKTSNGNIGWVSGKYIEIQNNDQINNVAQQVIAVAEQQIGKPYKWGGNGPDSFDCSGLTSYAYKHGANITLPRVSREQANIGNTVSKDDLQPADLVFFSSNGKTITHVGIYIGDSKMVHAPSTGKNIKIDSINSSYYQRTYVTAKRVL